MDRASKLATETYERITAEAENKRLREALAVPAVWTREETIGMEQAYREASKKHGHLESLFAVGAWLLRHRSAALQTEE